MHWAFEDPWGGSAGESGCALEAFAGDEQSFKGGVLGCLTADKRCMGVRIFQGRPSNFLQAGGSVGLRGSGAGLRGGNL